MYFDKIEDVGMPAKVPHNAEDCNCFAVRSAARHITQLYDQYLAPVGLRATQFSILTRLKRKGPLTINALASEMITDRSTVGRNIQPLERDRLIAIEPSASDRRAKVLRLTAAGEKRLQAAVTAWSRAQDRFESDFGGKRSAEMRDLMGAIVASAFAPGSTPVEFSNDLALAGPPAEKT
jgi:DNA-binding MarR family transcriptional regulator